MWWSNHPYSKSKKQLQCLSPVEKGNTGKFCKNCKNLFNSYLWPHAKVHIHPSIHPTGPKRSCPAPFAYYDGSVSLDGWISLSKYQNVSNIECAKQCEMEAACCSFEYSATAQRCNINRECKPDNQTIGDFDFCGRGNHIHIDADWSFNRFWFMLKTYSTSKRPISPNFSWKAGVERRHQWIFWQRLPTRGKKGKGRRL